jgi:cytoplasmic iron level regulating protein YaaA (DUF328/UPF0246 family)
MLTVISPAKTLDFEAPLQTRRATQPELLDQAAALIDVARQQSPDDLRRLMKISPELAELNVRRFHNWAPPFSLENARQAVFAFRGDVYTGLDADTLSNDELGFAQQHLRILSGLYGALRPLDLMQAYRLEMGTRLSNERGKNLYDFWGDRITALLNQQLRKLDSRVLINLASEEYFKAVRPEALAAEVITPVFKDRRGAGYKVISFYAKKARGRMTRFIVQQGLTVPEGLRDFNWDGYRYAPRDSTAHEWVFLRDEA